MASSILPYLGSVPLSFTVPAVAAAASYVDARYGISNDWDLLGKFFSNIFKARWNEYKDRISVFYILEQWAQSNRADQAFVLYGDNSYTYKQAYEMSLRYGAWFKSKGVQPGQVIAMDFMNGDAFVFIWFGLWSIGAKPAFINYNLTDEPLLHSVRAAGTHLLVIEEEPAQNSLTPEIKAALEAPDFLGNGEGSTEVVVFDAALRAHVEALEPYRAPDEDRSGDKMPDMANLIYTSGTTGLPKPAIVSWGKCRLGAGFIGQWLPLKQGDVVYTCMPLYHSSAAILGVVSTLTQGSTIAIGRKFQRAGFWADVRKHNASVVQYVGETCRYLLSAPESPVDKQNRVRLAYGNGMRPDVWNKFKQRFDVAEVCEFYAATEGPSGMWNRDVNGFSTGAVGRNGALAKLIVGSSIAFIKLDFETNLPVRDPKTGLCSKVADGQPGELIYKLDEKNINERFQGYYRNDGATSKKVLRDVLVKGDAWFSTGDVLRDEDGLIYFCDRIGDTFRWKSENVSTAEVAEVLGRADDVAEANVYGVEVPGHDGRAGCAAIVFHAGKSADPVTLRKVAKHVTKGLPRYAVPLFLRMSTDADANTTGTNKQQKTHLRDQGVDPSKVPEDLFWLRPGSDTYEKFGEREWKLLVAGEAKL
ncbi:AMP-binding enzyme [Eremomyces bilateralis CBS 781.70]|uniref:Very long-chain fatty acid transport protein n=1 Tax=Eremomyces bilateralis CBS 781.70 TaxID=1392243 RepID=A0A6G1GHF0_9PEZI|nr:AMP-binding enzyme [Eremomyces bilateralis CBS 781.70]KAF1817483.1 AMP-binding enzyme [Eremomyces bilateralis CBS 781.70]